MPKPSQKEAKKRAPPTSFSALAPRGFRGPPKTAQRHLQEPPRTSPEPPRTPQAPPQDSPRRPKNPQITTSNLPKAHLDPPRPSQERRKQVKAPQNAPISTSKSQKSLTLSAQGGIDQCRVGGRVNPPPEDEHIQNSKHFYTPRGPRPRRISMRTLPFQTFLDPVSQPWQSFWFFP